MPRRGRNDLRVLALLYSYLNSGQRTAEELYKCMIEGVCEAVPEGGYGYRMC